MYELPLNNPNQEAVEYFSVEFLTGHVLGKVDFALIQCKNTH
jgi:hypothetical protein